MKKIVVIGCLSVSEEILKICHRNKAFEINHLVSIGENLAVKSKISGFVNLEKYSRQFKVPYYEAKDYGLKNEEDYQFFKTHHFDLMIVIGWQRLIPEKILKSLKFGSIGIHGSSMMLPRGRGRSPINWSLIEGKKRFIISYFLMKKGADDGDIFNYQVFDINKWDDCSTLYKKNAIVTSNVLKISIPLIFKNELKFIQQKGDASYYLKRSKEDGLIQWNNYGLDQIYNMVRALKKPYPGAHSFINGDEITIWEAYPFDTKIIYENAIPGEILEVFEDNHFIVNCIDGLLIVKDYDCKTLIKVGYVLE